MLQDGVRRDAESLRLELRNTIAAYKVPQYVHLVQSLPKSAAGKVLKEELRRQFQAVAPADKAA